MNWHVVSVRLAPARHPPPSYPPPYRAPYCILEGDTPFGIPRKGWISTHSNT